MFLNKIEYFTVKDIMSREFDFIDENATINEAILAMSKINAGDIFIKGEGGIPKGIVTLNDVVNIIRDDSCENIKEKFLLKNISDIPKDLIVIDMAESAIKARNIMKERSIGRLPVINEGKMVGVVRTIDILNKVYSKIDETKEAYEFVFDNLHEAVCVVDKEGIISLWGGRAEKLYGVSKEEAVGKKLKELFPKALLLDVLKTGKAAENAIHSPRENTYINISAMPLIVKEKLIGAVSTDRDISEVMNLSMELELTKEKLDYLQTEVSRMNEDKFSFGNILGKSLIMKNTVDIAAQVAATTSSVLISGESGTGKEVFARAIHQASGRSGPFVAINCSAIPDNLFESEMFGYEGGAFTGALSKGKVGKVELANKGTIFLDEIGDMPLYMQAKLLRVLQERQVSRVGGEKAVDVDIRVISATHRNLKDMVRTGAFREDLYYRLNVVNLKLPSLNERSEDIPMFVKYFMEDFCSENHINLPNIRPEVYQKLMGYEWPGNIRELKNTVEHLVVFSKNGEVTMESLPPHLLSRVKSIVKSESYDLQERVKSIEIETIHKAMELSGGNKLKAAKVLNIPRSTLYYKIKFYDLVEYM
ncbi:PAS domain S-box-containing protein [Acetoanaerobium pronyense]|uniref:PAS domain S-box-containing protein n=1 Tax=Acetoanaerobium pronyense TaxID=1482736 RepID=A0ABS4KJI7_9FIRM|nr:sigma-54 dependent transcriptional regulator PrdR [Acetoanaerobium pronyense]MBP2027923.1 PAS domain S-box-containing protein [Acetoanaerobium pronyense]